MRLRNEEGSLSLLVFCRGLGHLRLFVRWSLLEQGGGWGLGVGSCASGGLGFALKLDDLFDSFRNLDR